MKTSIKITWIVFGVLFLLFLLTLAFCLKSVDKHELGFTFNRFEGKINTLDRTGLFLMNPIKYSTHKIDLRPRQVSITANLDLGMRVLNAKLVRFDPAGLDTFIKWHGRNAGDNVTSLTEILKCYAFASDGGKSCPFLKVEAEIAPVQGMSIEK